MVERGRSEIGNVNFSSDKKTPGMLTGRLTDGRHQEFSVVTPQGTTSQIVQLFGEKVPDEK